MQRLIAAIGFLAMSWAGAGTAQTLYIPAAANAGGVNQTRWRTDLQIKAVGDVGATFTVELLETGENNDDPRAISRTVDAGSSLRLGNLLDTEFGVTGTAALRITPTDGRILATSRTFNDDPAGTYGQTVPGVAASAATAFGDRATLIQLSRSADPTTGFRTNIGFVGTVDRQVTVEIELYDASGTSLGTVTRTLQPFEHRQINDAFHAVGADDVDDGYAEVRTTTEDGRFIAYASVVDNGSGDAVFILGSADTEPVPSADRLVVFESFMRPG